MEKAIEYPQIAEELMEMRRVDQDMRKNWSETGDWDSSVDEENMKRMKEIVSEVGWLMP